MVLNTRKKNTRHRGSWTHGYGEKKKHRGAGSRGGRGLAGTGKRGDVKKPNIQANKKYFGKHGFNQKAQESFVAINVKSVESRIESFVAKELATQKGDVYTIDLTKAGYDKLLGTGAVTKVLNITVASASESAIEKVKAMGGSVTTTEAPAAEAAEE